MKRVKNNDFESKLKWLVEQRKRYPFAITDEIRDFNAKNPIFQNIINQIGIAKIERLNYNEQEINAIYFS